MTAPVLLHQHIAKVSFTTIIFLILVLTRTLPRPFIPSRVADMEFLNANNAPDTEEAEVKLDLRGMEKDAALAKLDATVQYCKKTSAATLYVFFDPAGPDSGETLFQPVARYFKFEKFNKYVISAVPVMTPDSGGLFVRFRL